MYFIRGDFLHSSRQAKKEPLAKVNLVAIEVSTETR